MITAAPRRAEDDGSTQRLFVALPCPLSPALADACALVHAEAATHTFRPTATGTLHLTLRFLGATPVATLPTLRARLDEVARRHRPFVLSLQGAGCFRDALWLGVAPDTRLDILVENVATALEPLGYPPDPRPFHAHVTLARMKNGRKRVMDGLLARLQRRDWGTFPADRLLLYRSELRPSGAAYCVIHEAEFAGCAGTRHDQS